MNPPAALQADQLIVQIKLGWGGVAAAGSHADAQRPFVVRHRGGGQSEHGSGFVRDQEVCDVLSRTSFGRWASTPERG